MKKIVNLIWVFFFVLTACGKNSPGNVQSSFATESGVVPPAINTGTPGSDLTNLPSPTQTSTLIPATDLPEPSATATTLLTATPDTRPLPEKWQEWPIVPEPTSRVYEIYAKGLELGNDPHHFSKIGDCHSVRAAFMGLFDKPGWYKLREGREHLQLSIDWFAGSYDRDGMGVKGGYNAAAVLSPLWADPQVCEPGENPVECEVRVWKPAFAIISLEVWWEGRTPEGYEKYMRTIIDLLIEHGVVPILATKADNIEGDHSLNLTTAKLAYEYNIPLWNFWKAAQELPDRGMDMERNDGFHISTLAWTVRSFTALETLDRMWESVNAIQ
ncbi:MAG: hypothetical protein ACYDH1_02120 [Anaerolineaceae bacterium]